MQAGKDLNTGGLVKVVDTVSLESVAERISYLLDAHIEAAADAFQFRKKRLVKNSVSTFCLMDVKLLVESFEDDGVASNKARIFLLPEELPLFTLALIQHPIPFPTNFSQCQTRNHGMYCVEMESQEAPENFAVRLSDALKLVERQVPKQAK